MSGSNGSTTDTYTEAEPKTLHVIPAPPGFWVQFLDIEGEEMGGVQVKRWLRPVVAWEIDTSDEYGPIGIGLVMNEDAVLGRPEAGWETVETAFYSTDPDTQPVINSDAAEDAVSRVRSARRQIAAMEEDAV